MPQTQSPQSPRRRFKLEFDSSGENRGLGWGGWVGLLLAALGIYLTLAFGLGWL